MQRLAVRGGRGVVGQAAGLVDQRLHGLHQPGDLRRAAADVQARELHPAAVVQRQVPGGKALPQLGDRLPQHRIHQRLHRARRVLRGRVAGRVEEVAVDDEHARHRLQVALHRAALGLLAHQADEPRALQDVHVVIQPRGLLAQFPRHLQRRHRAPAEHGENARPQWIGDGL